MAPISSASLFREPRAFRRSIDRAFPLVLHFGAVFVFALALALLFAFVFILTAIARGGETTQATLQAYTQKTLEIINSLLDGQV